MKKRDTCLIFGGKSEEYEVSLRSVCFVLENIDYSLFDVTVIGITRDGKWYYYEGDTDKILSDRWQENAHEQVIIDFARSCFIKSGKPYLPDIIFPVMHGSIYESGALQGMFDNLGIPVFGCGLTSSCLCFNKHLTKAVARAHKIPVARDILVSQAELDSFFEIICKANKLEYPLFVKPSSSGSSCGITKVYKPCMLYEAVKLALELSPYAIIEEQIVGSECEIVLYEKNGALLTTPVGKIKHDGDFYDYKTKYHSTKNEYEIPAIIQGEAENELVRMARVLFRALGCSSLARFDFFVRENKEIIFNEVNTLPGLTCDSMLPMLFNAGGIAPKELLTLLLG